ncbi:hypothetical protein HHK36_000757 [Tetracentron sinense]|uniref:Uncharacterized protein n=1 Tax=Tetracentron sinense TaxID=13715 RepID=A0A835DUA9_TETSI|nr:hypothetical protein HHK36_000757 [Tetracentron sinense]
MVLWEITLGTAYFLGLKRTYRLALRIQRRLITSKHPKIQQFAYRRIRAVFDIALRFHRNIQQRDIEVGRNIGNWILRRLDHMKPSAQIRGGPPGKPPTGNNPTKHLTNSSGQQPPGTIQRSSGRSADWESDRHLFASSTNMLRKPFPSLTMMIRPAKSAGTNIQYRHLCMSGPEMPRLNYGRSGFDGVIRKDIMQWMMRN